MKRFIVNSTIMPSEIDPMVCATGIPQMLKDAGIKNVHIRNCYCCNAERKVIFETEAENKESLSEALKKIDFPLESISEVTKI